MENNLLYKSASIHAERNDYKNRYGADAAILGKEDFVISEIEIDSSLPPTPVENGFLSAESLFSSSINLLGYISALNL